MFATKLLPNSHSLFQTRARVRSAALLIKTQVTSSHPELSGVVPVDGGWRIHRISFHCLNT